MSGIRRWSIVSIVFVLVAAAASAQTGSSQPKAPGDTEQQVKAAQQQMLEAAQQGNKDAVGNFVTDDLTWISAGNGQVTGKDQMLSMLPAPVHTVDVQRVVVSGNSAVLTGVAHMNDGTDVRFLQQWVDRDGQWKLRAHEGVKVAAATPAAGSPAMATTGTTGTTAMGGKPGFHSVAPTLSSDDERAVWQAQENLGNAFVAGDAKAYSKLTADAYVRITPEAVVGKTEFLKSVQENAKKSGGVLENSDVQILVDGNTARVVLKNSGTLPGGEQVPPTRVMRIFEKKNGQWQQVAAIFTPIVGQ
jgi:ketosteroid isomerase-like protein